MSGARAVVTGGASGIGAAVVSRLRSRRAAVAVLDLVPPPDGAADLTVSCDIADEHAVDAGMKEVRDTLGGIDVAVLNAGVGGFGPLLDMPLEDWDRVMAVNLRGTYLCLRAVGRLMVDAGRGGSVVAVTSVSGFLADRMMSHYSVSKAAVAQLVRVAARELGPFGIRVNAVAPGTTDTPLLASTGRLPGYRERVAERAALGGVGTPSGVAEAVEALLTLDWVTGQVLAADGGVSLWSPIDPAESLEGGAVRTPRSG
ncbi:MAG TPA: NAD(P)-dependent oxidoreductase [Acidimicrobiaceae bacterium]|nr:NAD(P)-dependent oxidoreductase [Acidimicrobiaceae bacterium]